MHNSLAFSQPATGPSSVCEGSDVTLQCRVVFSDNPRDSVWFRNGRGVRVGNDFIPNHNQIFIAGAFTDLVITDVTLEDDNTVYTCNSTDDSITSSVVLNVSGKFYACTYCDYILSDLTKCTFPLKVNDASIVIKTFSLVSAEPYCQ